MALPEGPRGHKSDTLANQYEEQITTSQADEKGKEDIITVRFAPREKETKEAPGE